MRAHRAHVIERWQRRVEHDEPRCAGRQAFERGRKLRRAILRLGGIAQRFDECAQVVGAMRQALRAAGQAALARHQRGHQGADQQHRAEQQRVLAQMDVEAAARRHEEPVEGEHRHCVARDGLDGREEERGQRRRQNQQHGEIGEVDPAVEQEHRGPGGGPDGECGKGAARQGQCGCG